MVVRRVLISVPADVGRAMRKRKDVNWSGVCAEAIRTCLSGKGFLPATLNRIDTLQEEITSLKQLVEMFLDKQKPKEEKGG